MTMTNPITQQFRETRHRLAAKFDNDLDRIVNDLQRQERESGRRYFDRTKETTKRSGSNDTSAEGESPSPTL